MIATFGPAAARRPTASAATLVVMSPIAGDARDRVRSCRNEVTSVAPDRYRDQRHVADVVPDEGLSSGSLRRRVYEIAPGVSGSSSGHPMSWRMDVVVAPAHPKLANARCSRLETYDV